MLGLKDKPFLGGVESCDITFEQLSTLLDLGVITPGYHYNDSPTVETYFEFGKRAKASGATVIYIGFLESKSRADATLIIEGVKVKNFPDSVSLIMDFSQTFHGADEFTANVELLRAWYD